MNNCAEIQKSGTKEVPEQLEDLRRLLEEMDNCIVSLEEELKPVLLVSLLHFMVSQKLSKFEK